jgi:hypothetical protein
MKKLLSSILLLILMLTALSSVLAFPVDTSPAPADYIENAPANGEVVAVNPPSLIWREDANAATYIVEISPDKTFKANVIRVSNVHFPFYNYSKVLSPGVWYWRYFVVNKTGETSAPGPERSFVINAKAVPVPVPPMSKIMADLPAHPRIFVSPATLSEFRDRRNNVAKDAWDTVRAQADELLNSAPKLPSKRIALEQARPLIAKVKTPNNNSWKPGDETRQQVFWLDANGDAFWTPDYTYRNLSSDAGKANLLAFAYLISGDKKYADAARQWVDFVADFRIDYHLGDAAHRGGPQEYSVVYCYEQGLKDEAIAYDHIYDFLSPAERQKVLSHVEYHTEAAIYHLKSRNIVSRFQQSHPQQCMHNTLTALLAVAGDSPEIDKMVAWIVPQYMNRIAWTSPDGGYSEGPTYSHKISWILEGLAAMRSATGVNLFKRPEIQNSGAFWLYCMDLNYWYQHFGDNYSMYWPYASGADAFISGMMAAMTDDPYVKWYSQTIKTNPDHIPFRYLSENQLAAKPPIDIPQARAFLETGQLTAFDKFYDHGSNRVFFRSSKWGGHSHAHADSNAFVIHAGNEVMAADATYYTYSGDTYDRNWSNATNSKNSILINGQGQGGDLPYHGQITQFYNGGDFAYFVGDASQAYDAPMKIFKRAMLFIRPNVYVVYDELAASKKSTFSWLLNTFAEPSIDAANQKMVVAQQQERLEVQQIFPKDLKYTTTNKRPYPMKTRAWTRFSEAFPQAWHTEVTTPAVDSDGILTLMQTYKTTDGANVKTLDQYQTESTMGLKIQESANRNATILFRRQLDKNGIIDSGGVRSDGQSATVFISDNLPDEWMITSGGDLLWQGKVLLHSANSISANASFHSNAAKAVVRFAGKPGEMKLHLPFAPKQVFASASENPEDATTIKSTFADGILTVNINDDSGVLWIDPTVNLAAPIPATSLAVTDSQGTYNIPLRGAWSETGDWVYYAQTDAREPGNYGFDGDGSNILIQDIWDPSKSGRGENSAKSTFHDGTEFYFTVKPGLTPKFTAQVQQTFKGQIDNVLHNGDFEEGIPNYPPRMWTVSGDRDGDLNWGGWSQENPRSGKSCLRFYHAKGPCYMTAQPMRLRNGGKYHLRFFAKGDADGAQIQINGALDHDLTIPIKSSADWQEYNAEIDLPPGYTTIQINMASTADKSVLWVDDMEFGRIAK